MRISIPVATMAILATLVLPNARAQKQPRISSQILAAKTIYFENKTASDAAGTNTLTQLKKWGKF